MKGSHLDVYGPQTHGAPLVWATALVALLGLCTSGHAWADERSPFVVVAKNKRALAILPAVIDGPHGAMEASAAYEALARSAEFVPEIRVVPYHRLVLDGQNTVSRRIGDCGSDLTCVSQALEDADIPLLLRAIVNFALKPPLVSLNLIDSASGRLLAEAIAELQTEQTLPSLLKTSAYRLFADGGLSVVGRLRVTTSPEGVQVRIGGKALPPRPIQRAVSMRPGTYEVIGEHDGYTAAKRTIHIEPGAPSELHLSLSETQSFMGSAWFWGLVGAAALGTTALVVVASQGGGDQPDGPRCLCIAAPGSVCGPCP